MVCRPLSWLYFLKHDFYIDMCMPPSLFIVIDLDIMNGEKKCVAYLFSEESCCEIIHHQSKGVVG